MRARRQVWRRRETELCGPEPEDDPDEPLEAPGQRPAPLPAGPIETYRSRLGPTELGGGARPAAADPPARPVGGHAEGAHPQGGLPGPGGVRRRRWTCCCAGAACCRWTGRPTAGWTASTPSWSTAPRSAPARRWSSTRPPTPTDGTDADVWTTAARLLGSIDDGDGDGARSDGRSRLGPPRTSPDAPGGEIRTVLEGRRRVGTVTVAAELDPHAEALLTAVTEAGHRLVLTAARRHAGDRRRRPTRSRSRRRACSTRCGGCSPRATACCSSPPSTVPRCSPRTSASPRSGPVALRPGEPTWSPAPAWWTPAGSSPPPVPPAR